MHAVDLHQHLWPEPFVEILRRRTRAPYLRGWQLVTESEPAFDVCPDDHDVARRIELDRRSGIGLACLSLSAPLGLESLPPDEARPLIEAWHDGARALPAHFAAWASVPTTEQDPTDFRRLLEAGFVGLQLPATELMSPSGWENVADLLRVAELCGKPVLVHPGPASPAGGDVPSWWAPVVAYVAQMQAAWWAWQAFGGRSQFTQLRLVFAAGAGLAPVHHERLTARGGEYGAVDPNVFVDTSSYGAQGLDALARALGIDVLVLGSDRPYADPLESVLGDAATRMVRVDNPRRALGPLTRLGTAPTTTPDDMEAVA